MYKRKTTNDAELSNALSIASKSRKAFRGGRPKGWRKNPDDCQPSTTFSAGIQDAVIFKALARNKGWTMRQLFHAIAAMIVYGKGFSAHRGYAPNGWNYIPPQMANG